MLKKSLMALALVGAAASAQAATVSFGELLSGDGAPSSPDFATLTYSESGGNVNFVLSAPGLDLFNTGAFIRTMVVDGTYIGSVSDVSGGVTMVGIGNGGGPSGSGNSWDFKFTFGQGQDRLIDGETISWTWVGGAGNYTDFALHVQGLTGFGGTNSAWYNDTPPPPPPPEVPLPGTLGLLGLGLMGLGAARRRKA